MQGDIKQIQLVDIGVKNKSVLSRLLPIFLFLSFVWLNLYDSMSAVSNIGILGELNSSLMFFGVLFVGLIQYILFEILFFIYRFCIGFSIYSFMIPKRVIMNKFRLWFLVRNLIMGLVYNLRFFFPYIATYLCVVEIIFNFITIIILYFDTAKDYVEPLVGQFVFRTLSLPIFLYQVYRIIVLMAGVL